MLRSLSRSLAIACWCAGYGDYFRVGMAALHGPELPLELFSRDEQKPKEVRGRDWDSYRIKRMEEVCGLPTLIAC